MLDFDGDTLMLPIARLLANERQWVSSLLASNLLFGIGLQRKYDTNMRIWLR